MITTSFLLFGISFIIACYAIPKIIYIAKKKHLFDEPTEYRKIHIVRTPNLGGIAIFSSVFFLATFFIPHTPLPNQQYILSAALLLFILGVTDDLVGVDPVKKILAQLLVALMLAILADCRITSLYGFLGVMKLHYVVSVALSTLFILLVINSFNLIDGIDCLAGSIGLLACVLFAWQFGKMNEPGLLFLSASLAGSLSGFLFFNRTPARIFMGDTGSLLLGFSIAFFSIRFLELNKPLQIQFSGPAIKSAPAIVAALLSIPVFDTLRVFALRLMKGKSPFHADRNHIHHLLIDVGMTHLRATGILLLVNAVFISLAFLLQSFGFEFILTGFTLICLLLTHFLWKTNLKILARQKTVVVEKINQPPTFAKPDLSSAFNN
jgi:UDP-GlcNAc:undecaprenyl-phosphate/decaprenyl-phosphate GlcNAc-1-phosphate transferase